MHDITAITTFDFCVHVCYIQSWVYSWYSTVYSIQFVKDLHVHVHVHAYVPTSDICWACCWLKLICVWSSFCSWQFWHLMSPSLMFKFEIYMYNHSTTDGAKMYDSTHISTNKHALILYPTLAYYYILLSIEWLLVSNSGHFLLRMYQLSPTVGCFLPTIFLYKEAKNIQNWQSIKFLAGSINLLMISYPSIRAGVVSFLALILL